jgi:hypothetical protein
VNEEVPPIQADGRGMTAIPVGEMAHQQGESMQISWLWRCETFLGEIGTVTVRGPWSVRDPRLPFAQGRLLFIYVDANAPRRISVHLQ